MKMIDRNVEASMPPATAVPTELRAPAPAPGRKCQRQHAEDERERRHQNRPQPDPRRLDRRVDDRLALLAQLLGELDNQDRVLRRQADQHDESYLAEHVVGESPHELRAERAEDRQRHAQQDDERQHQLSYCAASTR